MRAAAKGFAIQFEKQFLEIVRLERRPVLCFEGVRVPSNSWML
jgi:hypothetical protein